MKARLSILALAFSLLATTIASAAPEHEARAARAFKEGQAAFAGGEYARAGELFELAHHEKPHHGALWNAARSWQRAGEDARAAALFRRFLDEAPPDAPEREEANLTLTTLGRYLGRLEVKGDDLHDVRIDGVRADTPIAYVKPGEHVVTARRAGTTVKEVCTIAGGELKAIVFRETPKPAPRETIAPKPQPPRESETSRGLSPWFVVVGGGITAVSATGLILSGVDGLDKRDAFDAEPTSREKFDRLESAETRTNILIGTTALFAVGTGVLAAFFVDWSGRSSTSARRVNLHVGLGAMGVTGVLP